MRPGLQRRALLLAGLSLCSSYASALTPRRLQFPRDFGSHPDLRIEWWYLTGALSAQPAGERFGFQLTFFRARVAATQAMGSAFAAKQLLFAHAAVTDVAGKKLWHDQRLARSGFGLAQASQTDTAASTLPGAEPECVAGKPLVRRAASSDLPTSTSASTTIKVP